MRVKTPYATLAVITFSITLYFLISQGEPYISPISRLAPYGVSYLNLFPGGVLYSFTHIGLKHLMANMFVLAVVGSIIEQRLESHHTLAVYFLAGLIAGIIYTSLNHQVWVLGASAAICGLLGAGMILDFKKTILGLVLAIYLTPIIVYPLADWITLNFYQKHEEKIKSGVQRIIKYQKALKNATGEKRVIISKKINETYKIVKQEVKRKKELVEGVKKESVTPTSDIIHIIGAIVGAVYLAIFRRDAYIKIKNDVYGIIKSGNILVGKGTR